MHRLPRVARGPEPPLVHGVGAMWGWPRSSPARMPHQRGWPGSSLPSCCAMALSPGCNSPLLCGQWAQGLASLSGWVLFFLAVCKHHPSQCPTALIIRLATIRKVKVQALQKASCTKAQLVLAVHVRHQKYLTVTESSWRQMDQCLFVQQQHPGSSRRVQSWHWRHRASNERLTGKSTYREWDLMSYIQHDHQQTGK